MAANTRYTPAPTQDPDLGTWSQAPPSYQAEAALFEAAPRSSEDNIPDDFKFGGSVAEATVDIRNQFIRKVYTILTAQLVVTGIVSGISFWNEQYKIWIQLHPGLVFVSVRYTHTLHPFVPSINEWIIRFSYMMATNIMDASL